MLTVDLQPDICGNLPGARRIVWLQNSAQYQQQRNSPSTLHPQTPFNFTLYSKILTASHCRTLSSATNRVGTLFSYWNGWSAVGSCQLCGYIGFAVPPPPPSAIPCLRYVSKFTRLGMSKTVEEPCSKPLAISIIAPFCQQAFLLISKFMTYRFPKLIHYKLI